MIITADHGNAQMMHDETTGRAHTAHSLDRVPSLYVGREATIAPGGAPQDIAPTRLLMMGLPPPAEMARRPLLAFAETPNGGCRAPGGPARRELAERLRVRCG